MSTIVEKSLNALNKEGPFLEIRNVFRGWELGVPNPMSLGYYLNRDFMILALKNLFINHFVSIPIRVVLRIWIKLE